MSVMEAPTKKGPPILTVADGGSLVALRKKGNLIHVEKLYNPNNYFSEVHILVFRKEDLTVKLENPTLTVHYIKHLPGKIGLMLSLPYMIVQILHLIRLHGIRLIRARNAYVAGLLAILAGKLSRIPTVISLGGDNRLVQKLLGYYYLRSRFLSYHLEEFSLTRADLVFSVNQFTSDYAKRLGVMPKKIRLVPHRIDVDLAAYEKDAEEARLQLGLGDAPILLMVGRLDRDKQVDVLIEAIPAINKAHPNLKFIFVGDGNMRPQLIDRVNQFGLQDVVDFVGFKPRETVVSYLAAATLVWIPMSGFVVYEAAAAGKAMVTFDVEWHSEFITQDETGMLVLNRDHQMLAQTVITLLHDPQKLKMLGSKAKARLQEKFDRDEIIETEIKAYEELIQPETI